MPTSLSLLIPWPLLSSIKTLEFQPYFTWAIAFSRLTGATPAAN